MVTEKHIRMAIWGITVLWVISILTSIGLAFIYPFEFITNNINPYVTLVFASIGGLLIFVRLIIDHFTKMIITGEIKKGSNQSRRPEHIPSLIIGRSCVEDEEDLIVHSFITAVISIFVLTTLPLIMWLFPVVFTIILTYQLILWVKNDE